MPALRVVLWDQLTNDLSSLKNIDKSNDIVFLCEAKEECLYVKHHKAKLVFLISSMRHFADMLIKQGYSVRYVKLDDKKNTQTLASEIARATKETKSAKILITQPGEYRVLQNLKKLSTTLNVEFLEDDRYLISTEEFKHWAGDKKILRMEFFYREMRKKYRVLMQDNLPEGGKWNFDAENRSFPKGKIAIPPPIKHKPDSITQEVIRLVETNFTDHFGETSTFHYAVTREDALKVLKAFIRDRLAHFGDYQDVMMQDQPWLFHSHVSLYINNGLLSPVECIKAAEAAYYHNTASLPATEGFIRQILGWREFVRGIYWLKMPDYQQSNYLRADRRLPSFYWTAETNMNCIKQCVSETRSHAYAHHIQRLMVLGNLALLTGVHPDAVNEWYLIVYADAHEWVELPNVTGMILYADGGYLASKPYAGGGAYINKMSNYCENCVYNVKQKNGPEACPFNYLYWYFLIKNRAKLKDNQRLSMIYSVVDRMSRDKIEEIRRDAESFLTQIESANNDWYKNN